MVFVNDFCLQQQTMDSENEKEKDYIYMKKVWCGKEVKNTEKKRKEN